jgi:hypothetical protein
MILSRIKVIMGLLLILAWIHTMFYVCASEACDPYAIAIEYIMAYKNGDFEGWYKIDYLSHFPMDGRIDKEKDRKRFNFLRHPHDRSAYLGVPELLKKNPRFEMIKITQMGQFYNVEILAKKGSNNIGILIVSVHISSCLADVIVKRSY